MPDGRPSGVVRRGRRTAAVAGLEIEIGHRDCCVGLGVVAGLFRSAVKGKFLLVGDYYSVTASLPLNQVGRQKRKCRTLVYAVVVGIVVRLWVMRRRYVFGDVLLPRDKQ